MFVKELKEECKDLAIRIRKARSQKKDFQRGVRSEYPEESLDRLRFEFRHKHIAYCQLRGRDYSVIETNPRTDPNWTYVSEIQKPFEERAKNEAQATEDVRVCA